MIRLTRQQVREVDRRATEQYQIPGIVLMENAARAVADAAARLAGAGSGEILILCGGGNNGGDGLAAARHLHNRGLAIRIALTADPARYRGDALTNWRIVQAMNLPAAPADPTMIETSHPRLIVDAIFGTGLTRPPEAPFGRIVAALSRQLAPVLAIDVPSGLDCDTGQPLGPCVRARLTITFVAEKTGFAVPAARPYLGEIQVADIGCPVELIEQVLHDMEEKTPHANVPGGRKPRQSGP